MVKFELRVISWAWRGYKDPALLASLVRSIITYQNSGVVDPDGGSIKKVGANQITKSQILHFLGENPEIPNYIDRYKKNNIVYSATSAFCYWLLAQDDQDKAEEYLDQVLLAYDLKPVTLTSCLFDKLQRNRNAIQNKMTKTAIIANIVEGYRRYVGYSKNKSPHINLSTQKGIPKLP